MLLIHSEDLKLDPIITHATGEPQIIRFPQPHCSIIARLHLCKRKDIGMQSWCFKKRAQEIYSGKKECGMVVSSLPHNINYRYKMFNFIQKMIPTNISWLSKIFVFQNNIFPSIPLFTLVLSINSLSYKLAIPSLMSSLHLTFFPWFKYKIS